MNDYRIGTAGWSYEDWKGVVYPDGMPRRTHPLEYLARFIDLIEINSTFYRAVAPSLVLNWVRKVEAFRSFLFAVKIHQMFTHERKGFAGKDIDEFRRSVEPLIAHEKLAAVLIQFPWSFSFSLANRQYLESLLNSLKGLPSAVEVRHGSWNNRDFFALLEANQAAFCNVDQPIFGNSIGPTALSTNPDFAYVRFHGRNAKDWFRKDAGRDDRYNYLYSKDELREWIERIKQLGRKSGKVYVITNNHYRGQAMANALQIKNLLTGEKVEVPEPLLERYPVLEEIIRKIERGQKDLFMV